MSNFGSPKSGLIHTDQFQFKPIAFIQNITPFFYSFFSDEIWSFDLYAMYLFVQFENRVINSLIATQGFSMSYSISIFSSASSCFVPQRWKLLFIRKPLLENFALHFVFQRLLLLIDSEEKISQLIVLKLVRVDNAISSVWAVEVIPARKIVENFICDCLYFSYWEFSCISDCSPAYKTLRMNNGATINKDWSKI